MPSTDNIRGIFRWPLRRDRAIPGDRMTDGTYYGLHILYPEDENSTAAELQTIDIVAVHGLGGHAMKTWTHAATGNLWLRDFLPLTIPNARIMTFGYDARVVDSRSIVEMMENANSLLTHLCNYRNSRDLEARPLIFIGHSLGGLIIKKALIMAGMANATRQILNATQAVMFMGVPHDGTDAAALANRIVKVARLFFDLNRTTLKALKRDSRQLKEISLNFGYLEGFDIITVMESERTAIPGTSRSVLVVPQTSARLNLGNREEWFNIAGADHHGVCKFAAEDNAGYTMVREGLRKQMAKLSYPVTMEMLLFALSRAGSNQLVHHLLAVDQRNPESGTEPPSHDPPRPYWIFKNMDFERWQSTHGLEVLWISGPDECRIPEASSRIVKLAMETLSEEAQHSVLYFSCSTVLKKVPIATAFVNTIIHQLVCSLPTLKEEVTAVFLHALLEAIVEEEPLTNQLLSRFKRDDSVEAIIKKILKASSNEYWGALRAVMDVDRERKLTLIIDGLDKTENQKYEFIKEVCAFIEDLRDRPATTRVLVTSRPQAAIKEMLSGVPCIEYDRERKECLNSLRFDNTRYEKISEQHEGSFEWLWKNENYLAWSSMDRSDLLLIEGKPGSGKSTLMKYFQRSLMGREASEKRVVASFYYSYREGEQQTNHFNMLRSILHDLLSQNEEFFFHFQPYYRQAAKAGGQPQWSYDSLKQILLSFTKNHPVKERLYLIVDAVDESDDGERYDIIELLRNLCTENGPCIVKVFVASRPVAGLSGQPATTNKVIRLQDVNYSDIVRFAESFLVPELDFPQDIASLATEYIAQNAQGVFVWVRLAREELIKHARSGCTKVQLFRYLKSLPTELEVFYGRILTQLERGEVEDVAIGQMMLQFVLFAFRPLRLEEFRHALAIQGGLDDTFSCSDESFEEELILGIEKRVICCAGNLLEIRGSQENRIVQVMHQTVPEFFRPSGPTAQTKFLMNSENGHRRMAITCIRYLMLCSARTSLADQLPDIKSWTFEHFEAYVRYLRQRPFTIYALMYLEKHIHRCGEVREDSRIAGPLAQLCKQLVNPKNPISYILENWAPRSWCLGATANRQHNSCDGKIIRALLLHTATQKQYPRVVEALLVAGAEIEACKDGKTALIVAAESGNYEIVQLLLNQGACIGGMDSGKRTALHLAASNGHVAVVRLLIERGADMGAEDLGKQRGLHFAATNGHAAVVTVLIDRGAYIEAEDYEGWRGLHLAAANGHTAVVRLLIDRGADKEAEDSEGQRGLHLAAGNGHNPVIELLVGRGADKEAKDVLGWQALHTAAWHGYEGTIQMLVEALGSNKEAKDGCGWTALHVAAMSGQDAAIRMLVENLDADKKAEDNIGWTALHFAAMFGLKNTTQLLVEILNVNKKARNKEGRTALEVAQDW